MQKLTSSNVVTLERVHGIKLCDVSRNLFVQYYVRSHNFYDLLQGTPQRLIYNFVCTYVYLHSQRQCNLHLRQSRDFYFSFSSVFASLLLLYFSSFSIFFNLVSHLPFLLLFHFSHLITFITLLLLPALHLLPCTYI